MPVADQDSQESRAAVPESTGCAVAKTMLRALQDADRSVPLAWVRTLRSSALFCIGIERNANDNVAQRNPGHHGADPQFLEKHREPCVGQLLAPRAGKDRTVCPSSPVAGTGALVPVAAQ